MKKYIKIFNNTLDTIMAESFALHTTESYSDTPEYIAQQRRNAQEYLSLVCNKYSHIIHNVFGVQPNEEAMRLEEMHHSILVNQWILNLELPCPIEPEWMVLKRTIDNIQKDILIRKTPMYYPKRR